MKQGLTKRERILIFIMIVVLIIFVSFRFVINPLYNFYLSESDLYDKLVYEKGMLEIKFQNEESIYTGYENAKKIYGDIKNNFPTFTSNEEIDRILTGLCVENKFIPIMLGISNPVEYNSSTNAENQESDRTSAFVIITATMNLSGDYNALINLINAVKNINYIRITKLSCSPSRSIIAADSANISINFEVTMLNAEK